MSRFRGAGSYGHAIDALGHGDFRLFWTVDRYYSGSRLRFPRTAYRDTDEDGAKRFAKRHDIELPAPNAAPSPLEDEPGAA